MKTKTAVQIVDLYFEAFEKNDLNTLINLFSTDGVVKPSSENYVKFKPKNFYEKVFEITESKVITLHSTAIDKDNSNIVIVNFGYDWTLINGSRKHFIFAFDKFEMDLSKSKIKSLMINLGPDVLLA